MTLESPGGGEGACAVLAEKHPTRVGHSTPLLLLGLAVVEDEILWGGEE